jgi:hypothetical protein
MNNTDIDKTASGNAVHCNFFVKIHKSIVSPGFYNSVVKFPFKAVIFFVLQMCLLTSLISGGAFTYYSIDVSRGLPALLPEVFPGMSIKKGTFDPGRSTPYFVDGSYAAKTLNMLFCMPGMFDVMPDSFIVVDTSENTALKNNGARLIFRSKYFEVNTGSGKPIKVSYSNIIAHPDTIIFSSQVIKRVLRENIVGVYINFFIQSGIINAGTLFLSIIFLTSVAYIFRIERRNSFVIYLKMASFAVTPVFLGVNLLALSGVQLADFWYVLVIASVIVMFRAVHSVTKQNLD